MFSPKSVCPPPLLFCVTKKSEVCSLSPGARRDGGQRWTTTTTKTSLIWSSTLNPKTMPTPSLDAAWHCSSCFLLRGWMPRDARHVNVVLLIVRRSFVWQCGAQQSRRGTASCSRRMLTHYSKARSRCPAVGRLVKSLSFITLFILRIDAVGVQQE